MLTGYLGPEPAVTLSFTYLGGACYMSSYFLVPVSCRSDLRCCAFHQAEITQQL